MPSILDYLDHPEFLQSVIGGGTADSFGPQPQQPPPPPMPPPDIMAQAPPQFGPGGAVDGGTSPTDAFSAQPPMPRPRPVPMPQPRPPNFGPTFADRAAPAQAAVESGDFDPQGMNYTDFGLSPSPGSAMGFAEAPRTRNGFPHEEPQGASPLPDAGVPMPRPNPMRGDEITVNRTPRNGMSLDDMEMNRPTPAGNPMDVRSPAQRGAPDPRIARARAFGNFMASLGHGLTAVGNQKPGTSGAAAFAGGAGGALTGGVENEKHNLDRDEKGLDRAERGRERDQTFDYQNRTLKANTKYHDDLVEQHRLDRGDRTEQHGLDRTDRTEQHRLDREERESRERWRPTNRLTPDGQMIYYDQKSSEERVGNQKGVGAAAPGSREAVFEQKRRAYLEVNPGDSKGALDYANGIKKLDDRDITRYATTQAQRDAHALAQSNTKFGNADQAVRDRYIQQRIEFWRRSFDPSNKPSPELPGALPTGQRAGVDPDRFRLPSVPPPALPGQAMAAPGTPGTAGPAPGAPPGTLSRPPLPGPGAGQPPPPNPGEPPAQWRQRVGLPPVNAPNGAGGAGAPAGPAPAMKVGPTPPPPPNVPPGSKYSPSRNAWRAPDGTIIPGAPPQQ